MADVRVVLADTHAYLRTLMKSAFLEIGIRQIQDAKRIDQIADCLSMNDSPDLLICDASMSEETCAMICDVRHSKVGRNPFLCIIAVTWKPEKTDIDRIIDAGVDALLVAPFAPRQLFDTINRMVTRRMPFVVTGDYIGPNRRNDGTEDEDTELLDVPNSLQAKANDQFDAAYMELAISQTIRRVKKCRMQYHAADIADAAASIIRQLGSASSRLVKTQLKELSQTLYDLKKLAGQQELDNVVELTQATFRVLSNLMETAEHPSDNNIKLLEQLSLAIHTALDPDQQDAAAAVHDITRTVGQVG